MLMRRAYLLMRMRIYNKYYTDKWLRPHMTLQIIQKNIALAKQKGAEVIVLLSHNGFDVDQKLATILEGVDVILTGHTHDAIPRAIKIKNTSASSPTGPCA